MKRSVTFRSRTASVKDRVGQEPRRSRTASVKDRVGQGPRRSRTGSVKDRVGEGSVDDLVIRSRTASVKYRVCQGPRRSKPASLKDRVGQGQRRSRTASDRSTIASLFSSRIDLSRSTVDPGSIILITSTGLIIYHVLHEATVAKVNEIRLVLALPAGVNSFIDAPLKVKVLASRNQALL